MAQMTYQVILSSDGKHTVIVTGETEAEMQSANAWAKATYDTIVSRYGLKGASKPAAQNGEISAADETPICQIHQVLMVQVNGRKGPFWSCHEKNSDDSWCTYWPNVQA